MGTIVLGCVVAPNSGLLLANRDRQHENDKPDVRTGEVSGRYSFAEGLKKGTSIVDLAGKNDREANVWMKLESPTGKYRLVVAESRTSNWKVDPDINWPGPGSISIHNHEDFGSRRSYHPGPDDFGLSAYHDKTPYYLVDPTGATIRYGGVEWHWVDKDAIAGRGWEDAPVYLIPEHKPYVGTPHD